MSKSYAEAVNTPTADAKRSVDAKESANFKSYKDARRITYGKRRAGAMRPVEVAKPTDAA